METWAKVGIAGGATVVTVGVGVFFWRRRGLDPNNTTPPWSLKLPAGISGREVEVPQGAPRSETPIGTPGVVVAFRQKAAEQKFAQLKEYGLEWTNEDQQDRNPHQVAVRLVPQPNGGAAAWAAQAAASGYDVGLGNGYLVVQRRSNGEPPRGMPGVPPVPEPEIGGYYNMQPSEVLLVQGAYEMRDGHVLMETASWSAHKGHPIVVSKPIPPLPNGTEPHAWVRPPPADGGYQPPEWRRKMLKSEPFDASVRSLRDQFEQVAAIDWGRLKRRDEAKQQLTHFIEIKPGLLSVWQGQGDPAGQWVPDPTWVEADGMVLVEYTSQGTMETQFPKALWWVGFDPPAPWAALSPEEKSDALHSPPGHNPPEPGDNEANLRRVGGIDGNYGIPGYHAQLVPGLAPLVFWPAGAPPLWTRYVDASLPLGRSTPPLTTTMNVETFGEKFEDPWQRQQETQAYSRNADGEMEYLGQVPPTASSRIDAIFKKAMNPTYAGRGSPTLDQAQTAFNAAWEQFAAEKNASKDKYMNYLKQAAAVAAAATGQAYVVAIAAVIAEIVHLIPIQKIFYAKEMEEAEAAGAAVGFEYTVLIRAAVPFIARITHPTDVGGKDMGSVAMARITAVRRRQTELPREVIQVMQAYWGLAFNAIGAHQPRTPAGVPTVMSCFRALGGLNAWTGLANDEQVVLVGLPIAQLYGLHPRAFCEALWANAKGWSGWPGLLTEELDPSTDTKHPCNAWSVQWFDLALTAFTLAEGVLKGTVRIPEWDWGEGLTL